MAQKAVSRLSSYFLVPKARRDLYLIWRYIAKDSLDSADRVEEAVYQTCELIAQTPYIGHVRPEVTSRPILFFAVNAFPKYLVVYKPRKRPLEVIGIVHGARNLRARFR